ncbi:MULTISPECIES: D-amino acid aminotransferase [Ramlibacter]|uniref:D-amino acid aminotransferase n=1 Tax=Ramlibacter pinisoli TaxID=2682844 RepID=A0A6N8IX49_9BURK|nr:MULTISPECIES: D-amino acid aminotransferase [Ramlibacter]MBA2965590.1 D-amino acid aminotransferase [Ramlibacter sp. CGMCC 1.13660]MVQ30556.1 D-amino acid aminotransferase [Ramlibacter pinisoli]
MTDPTSTLPALPCYLNGEFSTVREARVSVLDRGFIFGDGIYEVVPVYAGRPFRFAEHMARMDRSLAEMRMRNPRTAAQWRELVDQLIDRYARYAGTAAAQTDQLVYIQITRGVAMRDHAMPQDIEPTVYAMANRMGSYDAETRARGFSCVSADDFRWKKAHIKSTSLAGAVLSRQMSADEGAIETIMFRDGLLSEASSSNVWVVKDGAVAGPPRDNLVLEGIRYGLVEQLCRQAGIPFELRRIGRDEVLTADELLLSSATKEVLPVTTLDGRPVGNGRPGPIYDKLYAGYQLAKQAQA